MMKCTDRIIAGLFFSFIALQAPAVVIFEENFDSIADGTTVGTNSKIGTGAFYTRNAANITITSSPAGAFTPASGHAAQVSVKDGGAWAFLAGNFGSSSLPTGTFTEGDEVVLSFDMYIQQLPTSGNDNLRMEIGSTTWNRTFSEYWSGTVGDVVSVSYTNTITAAEAGTQTYNFRICCGGATSQGTTTYNAFQLDNVKIETIPSTAPPVTVTPSAATSPVPFDGKELVPFDAELVWGSLTSAVEYVVYLDTDASAVSNSTASALLGSVTNCAINPHGLAFNQTYYWRVDSVYPTNTVAGDVWSFTTAERCAGERPNIIYILVDDLNHVGLSAYNPGGSMYNYWGSPLFDEPISTPRIDSLAETGMRFDHFYSYQLCEPTRVSLFSGMNNRRNFTGHWDLSESTVTFANVLQDAGYATCLTGKWKQGGKSSTNPELDTLNKFGFDEYMAFLFDLYGNYYKNPSLNVNGVKTHYTNGEYSSDLINEYALDFIERNADGPFFLCYPMILVHLPTGPTPDTPGTAYDDYNGTDRLDQYYPDMIAYMDKMIGQLIDKVDELGIREDTCIIFTGDNGTIGGMVQRFADGSLYRGAKGHHTDAGLHVPLIVNQPGMVPSGPEATPEVNDDLLLIADIYPTLCDMAGVSLPENLLLDGRSFYPQTLGEAGKPRDYLYHYASNNGADLGAVPPPYDSTPSDLYVYVWNKDYKLYSNDSEASVAGNFVDLQNDLLDESSLLDTTSLTATQQVVYDQFSQILADRAFTEAEAIGLGHGDIQLNIGQTFLAKATVLPVNATRRTLKWLSNDTAVASVNKDGSITATGIGSTTVTVTSFDATATDTFGVTVVAAPADSVGDGLPDAWRSAHFGGVVSGRSGADDDPDGDGLTNREEFAIGGDPNVAEEPLAPFFVQNGSKLQLQFTHPLPIGYDGTTLLHTLEYRADLSSGEWSMVPGFYNVPAGNQTNSIKISSQETSGFYRFSGTTE